MLDENQEKVEDNKNNLEQDVVSSSEKTPETEQQVTSTVENQEVSDVVNEIQEEIAATAEVSAENNQVPEFVKEIDYSKMPLENLVAELERVLKDQPVHKVKNQVDAIKNAFNLKFGALLAEKKAAFIEAGGESIDFQFSSPIKTTYNALLSQHKKERDAYYADLEKAQKLNLEKRFEVIEALKALTITAASINGIEDRVGSLEVGKDADIVIWDGPIFDIMTRPKMVIIDGQIVHQR